MSGQPTEHFHEGHQVLPSQLGQTGLKQHEDRIGKQVAVERSLDNVRSLARVNDLALDPMSVSPAEIRAAIDSLSANTVQLGSGRTPLNLTGDGGTNSFLVLSAANAAGLNGAFYKTELTIVPRWKSSKIKVNLFGIPNGTNPLANPSAIKSATLTLEGSHWYSWSNVLGSLGLSGAGYILVAIDSSTYNASAYTMNAWANTYTAAPSGGVFRTPVPVFTDASLFGSYGYCYDNVTQNALNRANIVVFNIDTSRSLTLDIYFASWESSEWGSPVAVTLAPGESRQYSIASLFPGVIGGADLYFDYRSGGSWVGYVVRTDNGTNDGLLELPYKDNFSAWPN